MIHCDFRDVLSKINDLQDNSEHDLTLDNNLDQAQDETSILHQADGIPQHRIQKTSNIEEYFTAWEVQLEGRKTYFW